MSEIKDSNFAPIFAGWNVWNIYQVNDLDFSLLMVGVSPERQLRIFVEDWLRLAGVDIADSIDLKGSQVEILNGPPTGLKVVARKESLPLSIPAVNGPATLKTVRFFNRGEAQNVAWPHNDNYLLDEVFQPSSDAPATSGPPPSTIGGNIGSGLLKPIEDLAKKAATSPIVWIGGALLTAYLFLKGKKSVRRLRK